ncbi:MAG: Ldh family oxidoreductase [Verrucomicrobiota bacterium]
MSDQLFVIPEDQHNALVIKAYQHRGYNEEEAKLATKMCAEATRHGNNTHNALKGLSLDSKLGSKKGNWAPDVEIEVRESRFKAVESWNANRKIGQAVAYKAFDRCVELAEEYGVGVVSVDNGSHYLWGAGYAIEYAKRGYIVYTNCTSSLAEVSPFMGKYPTLGTNPHTWGFPTFDDAGFPVILDWATSEIAMGRVEQLKREGQKLLSKDWALDKEGNPTDDPHSVFALQTFGRHKGYGLCILNELFAAVTGGSLPTIRGRDNAPEGEKVTTSFYFQVIHPEALSGGDYACGRDMVGNVSAVIADILGHGNEGCMLPGGPEHRGLQRTEKAGGLLFTENEIAGFADLAQECGEDTSAWTAEGFQKFEG